MTARWFEVYAPLQEFYWSGESLEMSPGLWVRRFEQKPDLRTLDAMLGQDEQDQLSQARHWLTFRWDDGSDPSAAETVNLVLLALWIARFTKAHVAYRFHLGQNAAGGEQGRHRLLDRFGFIPGATHETFEDADLQLASCYYQVLHSLCRARGRLNNALVLTMAGCWAHKWQVALICHAAAAEALLTYDASRGLTHRLATSYACLVETERPQRDAAYREFRDLYSARSDIMHGRTYNVPASERLPTLARFQDVIRKLWRAVISSSSLTAVLESTDAQRKSCLQSVQTGYTPPP
jgi:hypothetical protein